MKTIMFAWLFLTAAWLVREWFLYAKVWARIKWFFSHLSLRTTFILLWFVFPVVVYGLIFLATVSRAHAEPFVPSKTVPLADENIYRQLRLDWFHQLQRQPGGVNPGTPTDSRPGRISVYAQGGAT
jgi:hypothetical protein